MDELVCSIIGHKVELAWRFENNVARWRCHRCGLWALAEHKEDAQFS